MGMTKEEKLKQCKYLDTPEFKSFKNFCLSEYLKSRDRKFSVNHL